MYGYAEINLTVRLVCSPEYYTGEFCDKLKMFPEDTVTTEADMGFSTGMNLTSSTGISDVVKISISVVIVVFCLALALLILGVLYFRRKSSKTFDNVISSVAVQHEEVIENVSPKLCMYPSIIVTLYDAVTA